MVRNKNNHVGLKLACAAAGALLASSAWAQGMPQGMYLGGGIGRGELSMPASAGRIGSVAVSGSGNTSNDNAYSLYGGYQFTPNWGLELGYDNLGNSYSENISVNGVSGTVSGKVHNWYLAGTGTLPLGSGWSLLGKLGIVRNTTDFATLCSSAVCAPRGSTSRTQPLIGIGAQYDFAPHWGARLEYDDYGKASGGDFLGTGGSGSLKARAWNFSVKYSF